MLDACNTLSFAATVDPMRAANRRARQPVFDWHFFTPGEDEARLTSGLTVPANPLARAERADLCLVVGGFDLDRQCTPDVLAGLRRLAGQGALMAGVDGGAWVLARAGVLDGHRATTHWEDLERMAERFPSVEVVPDRLVVSGARITCGGAAPSIDMMLMLIRAIRGPELANAVSGLFLYDAEDRPDRPQETSGAKVLRRVPALGRAVQIMGANLDAPLAIPEIARSVGLSPRRLQMLFRQHLNATPAAYYLSIRLSAAERLTRDTAMPVNQIALATGFASQAVFARAFRRQFGQSVREMRRAL